METLADFVNLRVVKQCDPMPDFATAMYVAAVLAENGIKVKAFKQFGISWVI